MVPPFVVRIFSEEQRHSMTRFYLNFQVPEVPENVSTISDGTAYINVNTQLLNIQVECIPSKISNITLGPTGNFSFSTSLSSTCRQTFSGTVRPNYSAWLGVFSQADPSCVRVINSSAPSIDQVTLRNGLAPVAIGFMANGTVASAAYCYGYQRVFNSTVQFDFRLGRMVPPLENAVYIPGHALEQYVLNGCARIVFSLRLIDK